MRFLTNCRFGYLVDYDKHGKPVCTHPYDHGPYQELAKPKMFCLYSECQDACQYFKLTDDKLKQQRS